MRNPPPVTPWLDRMGRSDEKQQAVLNFLASGEVFSSLAVLAFLLNVSLPNVRRCVSGLEEKGYLLKERHYVNGRITDIFGISRNGVVFVAADPETQLFEVGRMKSQFITHRLSCQKVRITCERIGGRFFPESMLRNRGLKKIPDGLWHSPGHGKICVEIELEAKSRKRLQEIFHQYLVLMEGDEAVDMALYLVPEKMLRGMIKLFRSIPIPPVPRRDRLPDRRAFRFAVGSLERFPELTQYVYCDCQLNLVGGIDISMLE